MIGEALVDIVLDASGQVVARPGGGPYNAARTVGRLGIPVTFAGRLASDAFGRLLASGLAESGVALGVPRPSAAPTTLALASVTPSGSAEYRFYLDGTSAADLDYPDLLAALPAPVPAKSTVPTVPAEPAGLRQPSVDAVHVGGLGLVVEPLGTAIASLVAGGLPSQALLMVDPNCRPDAIADRAAYLRRLSGLAARADIVKASVEDLAYISPGEPPSRAAAGLLAGGARLVLVTDGPHPARAFLACGDEVAVPVPEVEVVDTIGAGDAFGGTFLAWWARHGLGRAALDSRDMVGSALRLAAEVSSLTCTRVGADPPRMTI